MIFTESDPVKFSLKHGISIISDKCRKCGIEVLVNIPVITKDFVGFESKDHGCGRNYIISHLKPRDNEILKLITE